MDTHFNTQSNNKILLTKGDYILSMATFVCHEALTDTDGPITTRYDNQSHSFKKKSGTSAMNFVKCPISTKEPLH